MRKMHPVYGLALTFIMLALGIYAHQQADIINAEELKKVSAAHNACIPGIKENLAAQDRLGPGE